eukprot:1159001-Pelagomonas_calceolata.AAC.18
MGILIASGNKGKRHTSHSPTRTPVLLRGRGTVSLMHVHGFREFEMNFRPLGIWTAALGSQSCTSNSPPKKEEMMLGNRSHPMASTAC